MHIQNLWLITSLPPTLPESSLQNFPWKPLSWNPAANSGEAQAATEKGSWRSNEVIWLTVPAVLPDGIHYPLTDMDNEAIWDTPAILMSWSSHLKQKSHLVHSWMVRNNKLLL